MENLSNPQYYYYRRDHLGDNREVWCANTNSTVQRTQYYPSGLPIAYNPDDNPGLQKRKYNGKEFVEMHGYDTYDIVWRQYYPAIMRFQTQDPEVENDYDLSPYSMCGNNTVLNTDPDGRVFGVDNLVGAVVGAGVEIGVQLISKGQVESWTKVGVSAAVGGLTSGASAATGLAKIAIEVTGEVAKAGVDAYNHNRLNNMKDAKNALIEGGKSYVSGKLIGTAVKGAGSLIKSTNVGSKMAGALERGANRTQFSKTEIKNGLKAMSNGTERNTKLANNLYNASKQGVNEIKNAPSTTTNMIANGIKDKEKKQ